MEFEVTLYYKSKIKLGLQTLPPLSNKQIEISCTCATVRLSIVTDLTQVVPARLRKQLIITANSVTVGSVE